MYKFYHNKKTKSMKKNLIFILCLFMFVFAGCSKNNDTSFVADKISDQSQTENQTTLLVLNELEKIENINNLDDETIKALSVISRTNILNNNATFDNDLIIEKSSYNERLINLINETEDEILSYENNDTKLDNILIETKTENNIWKKEIKKGDILKYLKENNISLANISETEYEINDEGFVENLIIGGKNISLKTLSKEFGLPSTKIINVENNLSSIIVYGQGKGNELNFNIEESISLAKNGQNYKKILKNRYNNFQIITYNKK